MSEDPLIVLILCLHLLRLVVAEVISEWHQQHIGPVQLSLLPVLVKKHHGLVLHIGLVNESWVDTPRAGGPQVEGGNPSEVKLAADL